MLGQAYIDGAIVPMSEARIPLDDIGLLRCFSIYEGITTVGTTPAFLEEHLDRLERSAELLGMVLPHTKGEMRDIVTRLGNEVTAARGDIRIVQTGGRSEDGITPSERGSLYAMVNNLAQFDEDLYTHGVKVMTYEFQRYLPECKTTHYTVAAMLQGTKNKSKATEILYTKDGNVLEAATCNIFIIKNGVLITPELDILHGITRMKVLEIAKREGMMTEERTVSLEECLNADEIFLSSSYKDVLPVTMVDDRSIGDGTVGPATRSFISHYQNLLMEDG